MAPTLHILDVKAGVTEQDSLDPISQGDHGFYHLNIAAPRAVVDSTLSPPDFRKLTKVGEKAYLAAIQCKLMYAKSYILKEQEFDLNPDRPGLHKELTILTLAEPPIIIVIAAIERIRLLMAATTMIKDMVEVRTKEDEELMTACAKYWDLWTEVRVYFTWQTPGKNVKEQEWRIDKIMDEVFQNVYGWDENERVGFDL